MFDFQFVTDFLIVQKCIVKFIQIFQEKKLEEVEVPKPQKTVWIKYDSPGVKG